MQQDLLKEFEKQFEDPIAPMVSRFLNFIIDLFLVNIILVIVWVFILISESVTLTNSGEPDNAAFYGITLFVYISYYTLLEASFGGRTFGKMITRTKAVTIEGSELTLIDCFKRSLVRLIPLEFVSIFFDENEMWHDKWTGTKVVKPKN
ncbi:MAG: RDD family protein [Chitinophagaceae bacterium]|nr:RDD family protein [Chitinophagaceae bacterium]